MLVVAHKVVSKAEGRVRDLATVEPGDRARDLAAEHGKDPRLVQVVLDESAEVLRAHHGVLICLTHHGFVCANAGVDRSNAPGDDQVVLLPADPDASARALRAALPGGPRWWWPTRSAAPGGWARPTWPSAPRAPAAGRLARAPRRPRPGDGGHRVAVADAVAGAADLARAKDGGTPAVVVRGLERFVTADDGPGAAALRRPPELDLFR